VGKPADGAEKLMASMNPLKNKWLQITGKITKSTKSNDEKFLLFV